MEETRPGERYHISYVEMSTTNIFCLNCLFLFISVVRFRRQTGTQLALYPTGEFSAAGPGGSGESELRFVI